MGGGFRLSHGPDIQGPPFWSITAKISLQILLTFNVCVTSNHHALHHILDNIN
jgi:hypothetical protein